jgi:cytochrome c556
MRKVCWVVLVAVALFGLTLVASEKPSDAYVKAMKDVQAAQMGLGAAVTAKDYDAVARYAATFRASFAVSEAFWSARKVDDAIAASKAASKGATDLERAAKAKDDEGIAAARRAVGGTCAGCHMAHRARLADGTFEIK